MGRFDISMTRSVHALCRVIGNAMTSNTYALTGLPVVVEGKVTPKASEFANTLIHVVELSIFAVAMLKPEERARALRIYLPWAIRNGLQAKGVINICWGGGI